MKVSKTLIQKYNQAVPRYTSYPPANHFTPDFNNTDYIEMLKLSNNQQPEHIAFYIHIPFCSKICFYCGCNAYPLGNQDRVKRYHNALLNEFEMILPYIDKNRKVSQIHFGGGTPNSIESEYLHEIIEIIRANFDFIENPEIAIECSPAHLDEKYIADLINIGFNRVSLGIQDFNEDILRHVNREIGIIPIEDIMSFLKEANPSISINFDFIYGLPGQNIKNYGKTISRAIELKPDRLVTFSYAHVPWMKRHQKILEKMKLPDADEKLDLFLTGYELLKQGGYISIGLDHFVLPEDELNLAYESKLLHRNFQGYCTKRTTGQVYALGVSSISQLTNGYAQNIKEVVPYMESIERSKLATEKGYILSNEQKIRKEIITSLMCNKQIDWNLFATNFNSDIDTVKSYFTLDSDILKQFENESILANTNILLQVTELGTLFIRNVAASIDPEFQNSKLNYSKSV